MSPCCGAEISIFEYYGSGEPSYNDAGLKFRCTQCGAVGDLEECEMEVAA